MTYKELQDSLFIFGLGERATLKEIKARHRKLVKQFHPDAGEKQDNEQIRKVNTAYRVLLAYVESYRFSFAEEEFYEQNPDQRLWRQFKDDPLWGRE
jgi:DnaJ-class molecular chaperone